MNTPTETTPISKQEKDLESTRSFKIVQIGCGVVGKAYVEAYQAAGCEVISIDANKELVKKYKDCMKICHIDDDMNFIKDVDFIMLSICTPEKDGRLDLSYLFGSIPNVATIVKNSPDAFVIIRSTVPPGTTRLYKKKLEAEIGKTCKVLFQPEFLRAVSAVKDALEPWCVIIGINDATDDEKTKLEALYTKFIKKKLIKFLNVEEAELQKIANNCFNATKISFTNQFDLLCKAYTEESGISISTDNIMEALVLSCEGYKNPKYGTKPGHAFWGSCLPKDIEELASLERKFFLSTPFFECVVRVNKLMQKKDNKPILEGDHHISSEELHFQNITRTRSTTL